jgi:hypothetical protein
MRCLSEQRKSALFVRKTWFLFSDRGVQSVSPIQAFGLKRSGVIWAFVDSFDAKKGLPTDVSGLQTGGVFSIYTTSPRRNRWKSLDQNKRRYLIYMNPWSWEEISIT